MFIDIFMIEVRVMEIVMILILIGLFVFIVFMFLLVDNLNKENDILRYIKDSSIERGKIVFLKLE